MTAQRAIPTNQGFEHFINEEVTLISSLNDARIQQMMDYSKQFLDKVFPLAKGSHKDVKSYVVYYQHLLAFLADGTQTGLSDPQQFVALSGYKEQPTSIVMKNAEGYHVELIFNPSGKRGMRDLANIDDIQVETPIATDSLMTSRNAQHTADRQWFSMVRGDSRVHTNKQGKAVCQCINQRKTFTGKDGEEYAVG